MPLLACRRPGSRLVRLDTCTTPAASPRLRLPPTVTVAGTHGTPGTWTLTQATAQLHPRRARSYLAAPPAPARQATANGIGPRFIDHHGPLAVTRSCPPPLQHISIRVFQTLSPCCAFTARIRRSLHPESLTLLPTRLQSETATTVKMCTTSQMRGHHDHSHDEHNHDHDHDHDHGHHHHHGLLGHHHHHDNVYLTSSNKHDAGVRITRIGLYSNLGMAIAKGAGGYIFNSQSMIADAWHSLTDLASDILTLATVSWSLRPPTKNFPLGFGKVESLGSLGVSSMLLFGGIFMCISSCQSLYAHWFLDAEAAAALLEHGHGHSHAHHHHHHHHGEGGPSLHAAWLAAGTVAIKEWLYHASMYFLFILSSFHPFPPIPPFLFFFFFSFFFCVFYPN
mgnify:CR=1 FL=1